MLKKYPIESYTLPCGLRIVFQQANIPVIFCGYVICAGTRNETDDESGMAHFIEHMTFKGTARRKALDVSRYLERVGGDLNAYTTKQETVYHATVMPRHFRRAVDLLTDIVFHSTYEQQEIEREVEVICDEIDSFRDSPADLIFDEFEGLLFPRQPLGRDVLGTKERLRTYTQADARAFADRWYRPEHAVFFVYGNMSYTVMLRWMMEVFEAEGFPAAEPAVVKLPRPRPRIKGVEKTIRRGTHQAHVVIGGPTFAGDDPRRFALSLLNNVLDGPGMSSRLNVALREKAGLVYSVDSYLNSYPDTGFWNVYYACDEADVDRCREIFDKELARLHFEGLGPRQLGEAKMQLCGQLTVAAAYHEDYALRMAKSYAFYNSQRTLDDLCKSIENVTVDEIFDVANEVYDPARLTTLMYR